MDKLEKYRQLVREILTSHAEIANTNDTVKDELIFDTERDHYQLAYIGWRGDKRIFGAVMHLDIIDGKIWIQYNGTEESVAERLEEMGVPPTDIVIGFHSSFKRQFTRYANN
ncbi:XisI protein [Okeania sp.]|uniref:XisI protein n=1 Tax=Okeania sp. TaxID=3100323 RepID=UPI002B4B260F|nr:XisI protein [Okeania sp.]MEB3343424.1 XisI protein [Okeania sp.]